LQQGHEGSGGLRTVDGTIVTILVEEGEKTTVIQVGVGDNDGIEAFQVKGFDAEAWIRSKGIIRSGIDSTV
jgi:hypothetical protein